MVNKVHADFAESVKSAMSGITDYDQAQERLADVIKSSKEKDADFEEKMKHAGSIAGEDRNLDPKVSQEDQLKAKRASEKEGTSTTHQRSTQILGNVPKTPENPSGSEAGQLQMQKAWNEARQRENEDRENAARQHAANIQINEGQNHNVTAPVTAPETTHTAS